MISRKEKMLLAVVSVFLCAGLTWYVGGELRPTAGDVLLIGAMSFLMWGMLICALRETSEYKPVLAPFLKRRLLTPLEENRRAKWREEGRAQERAEIQARLEKLGLDPREILADPDTRDSRARN